MSRRRTNEGEGKKMGQAKVKTEKGTLEKEGKGI
jgi:hypothetical protein